MRIYTRTGDQGTTGLFGGQRIQKDDVRIEAYGTLDELNVELGAFSTFDAICNSPVDLDWLRMLQSDLFTWGSHLATTDEAMLQHLPKLPLTRVQEMEDWMDSANEGLPELKQFLLPGGAAVIATCHRCRVLCRRAERRVIALSHLGPVPDGIIAYLNRLSDLFFVWSRVLHTRLGVEEIPWKSVD